MPALSKVVVTFCDIAMSQSPDDFNDSLPGSTCGRQVSPPPAYTSSSFAPALSTMCRP